MRQDNCLGLGSGSGTEFMDRRFHSRPRRQQYLPAVRGPGAGRHAPCAIFRGVPLLGKDRNSEARQPGLVHGAVLTANFAGRPLASGPLRDGGQAVRPIRRRRAQNGHGRLWCVVSLCRAMDGTWVMTVSGGALFWCVSHLDAVAEGDTGNGLRQLVSPFSRRQVFAAAMIGLNTMSRALSCESAPLVRTVRGRTDVLARGRPPERLRARSSTLIRRAASRAATGPNTRRARDRLELPMQAH